MCEMYLSIIKVYLVWLIFCWALDLSFKKNMLSWSQVAKSLFSRNVSALASNCKVFSSQSNREESEDNNNQKYDLQYMFGLQGKTSLITGGGRGIGRAVCLALASVGSNIVATDTVALGPHLQNMAEEITSFGVNFLPLICDVKDDNQINQTFREVERAFGKLDVLVCNAGVLGEDALPENVHMEAWREVFRVNVEGVMSCAQAAHPVMKENGGGKIIILSSMEGHFGVENQAAYCSSKGALLPLCKSLALAWATDNIQVNCVSPGHIGKTFVNPILVGEHNHHRLIDVIPAARLGTADDVIGPVLFLAGQASNYVTGTEIVVDGGASARSQTGQHA